MTTGMSVESPVRGDVHAGFGGRVRETERPRGRHRALARPYTFRFNRRRSRRRGLLFYRLLQQAILAERVTYRQLVANPQPRERPQPLHLRRRGRPPVVVAADRPWRQGQLAA